jgi:hypothetical protein
LGQNKPISSGSESDRDCDNRSSHIHDILKNLKEAAPATKRPEDSAIPHLYSIQETAQMQGKSHCRLGLHTIFIAKLD